MSRYTTIRDQLSMLDPQRLAYDAYQPLTRLQDYPPAAQLAALGLGFIVLCQETGLQVRDVLPYVDRALRDAEEQELPQVAAFRAYVREELLTAEAV